MSQADYLKECLSLFSRMGLAMFAILAIIVGATLRMIVAQADMLIPGTTFNFIQLGWIAILLAVVVCFGLGWRTWHYLNRLKKLTEVPYDLP